MGIKNGRFRVEGQSMTSTKHCSAQRPYVACLLSSDADEFLIQDKVISPPVAFYTTRLKTSCWLWEGHLEDLVPLTRLPKSWFYCILPFAAKILMALVGQLKIDYKLIMCRKVCIETFGCVVT